MSDNQFPQQHDAQGQADGERLKYTASDLALNQAALILEVVNLANARIKIGRERGLAGYVICADLLDDLHAIPTDQPALGRHDQVFVLLERFYKELLAREAEARSRVLSANENLRAEIAKHKAETAAMLEKAANIEFKAREIQYNYAYDPVGNNQLRKGEEVERKITLQSEAKDAIRALIPTDYAAALAEHDAKQYAMGFEAAHELRSCGHSRGDFRDKNFPESEIGYLKGGPLLNYSCVGCDSVAEGVQSAYELGISDGIESVARSRTSKVARLVRLKDLRKRLAARLAAARAPEETK